MKMEYKNDEIIEAYKIYTTLATKGSCLTADAKAYMRDERIEELVDQFAREDDATLIVGGDILYLVPLATTSPLHMSNEMIKKIYLSNSATNLDIYLMYVTIIILLGEFYNSYQSQEPTRSFIKIEEWLEAVHSRLESIGHIEEEELKKIEQNQEYNWSKILEKWMAIDDIKESAKKQVGHTNSRMSFLNMVKNFLEKQDMVQDIGNNEIELTEKTKVIVQRYYMDYEYNRGLLDFIYQFDKKERA